MLTLYYLYRISLIIAIISYMISLYSANEIKRKEDSVIIWTNVAFHNFSNVRIKFN